jgi:hypothetical protein
MNGQKDSRQLAATLYPLVGLEGIRYRFRLLRVREPIPQDNLRPKRMQQWADRLWRQELRCPVYPSTRFGYPAFLIPEGDSPVTGKSIALRDVPDKLYHIDVTEQSIEVAIEEAVGNERELVCRMLERPFSDTFRTLKDRFWRAEWTLFFRLLPENEHSSQDLVNAYRGVKFGVVLLQGREPYFAADIRTKYVGRKSLLSYTPQEKQIILQNHLDTDLRFEERPSFLRDNGPVKIPCRYAGGTGMSISQYEFNTTLETVYDYYRARYGTTSVNPEEDAVFVQDQKDAPAIAVPVSRLFPVFTTEYEGLRKCSVRSQMTPAERATTISAFLDELIEVRYEGRPISIRGDHLVRERTIFAPPRLEFGGNEILDPFPQGSPPPTSSQSFDSQVVRWGSAKMLALYRSGPYHNEPLPDAMLLYPQSIERSLRETLLQDVRKEIVQQTGQHLRVIQQRSYTVGRAEQMGSALLRLAVEIRAVNRRQLALVVLWDRFDGQVHGELKNTLSPVLSQCVTERVVRSISTHMNPQRATTQVRNLALAVLTEAGVQPWVLADRLHHDLHIGIDLLFGRIGYHFLYGTGGRLVVTEFGESRSKGKAREAIKKETLRRRIEESIRSIVEEGHDLQSIVIHRDGRWWPSEQAALREALIRLQSDNVLPPDVHCAVVEIRKNHLPVRLFTAVKENGSEFLQNPLPGTYLILDRQRVLLTTTGRPGAWDSPGGRTAGTLLLEIVDSIGAVDIEYIAEDAYRLTHLNWNAPDIEIGLPVTIRWADEALRETFRTLTKEEEEREDSASDESDDATFDEEEPDL